MHAPRVDRVEASWRLVVAAGAVTVLVSTAGPIALATRALGPSAEVRALGGVLVTAPFFVRAGRPADARLAPGDPPLPSPVDLLLRPAERP